MSKSDKQKAKVIITLEDLETGKITIDFEPELKVRNPNHGTNFQWFVANAVKEALKNE